MTPAQAEALEERIGALAVASLPLAVALLREAIRVPEDFVDRSPEQGGDPNCGTSNHEGPRIEFLRRALVEHGAVRRPEDAEFDAFGNLVWTLEDPSDGIPRADKRVIYWDGHCDTVRALRGQWRERIGGIDAYRGRLEGAPIDAEFLRRELGALPPEDLQHLVTPDAELRDQRLIEEDAAAAGDRTHRKLVVTWHTELADDADVERCVQLAGNLGRDRHATARKTKNCDVVPPLVPPQSARKNAPSLATVAKPLETGPHAGGGGDGVVAGHRHGPASDIPVFTPANIRSASRWSRSICATGSHRTIVAIFAPLDRGCITPGRVAAGLAGGIGAATDIELRSSPQ
jgi:hypothetical protein